MFKTEEEAIEAISKQEQRRLSEEQIQLIQKGIAKCEETIDILNQRIKVNKELIEQYQKLLESDAQDCANIEKVRKLIEELTIF